MNGVALRPYHSALPGGNATIYATVYGSWNTLLLKDMKLYVLIWMLKMGMLLERLLYLQKM